MEKINVLQERIKERANERFTREINLLFDNLSKNEIGQRLKIDGHYLISNSTEGQFFNRYAITDVCKKKTNIEDIKNELIERYIKEETDSILGKIEVLSDFLENKE